MKYVYRIFTFLVIVILLAGLFFAYSFRPSTDNIGSKKLKRTIEKEKTEEAKPETLNPFVEDKIMRVLAIGTDNTPTKDDPEAKDRGRADVIMLFSIDPKSKSVHLLSIPRDSRVNIPGVGLDKINASYMYGGIQKTVDTVEEFLGIEIDHYGIVKYNAVEELVDAIGGVDVYVPSDYRHVDDWVIPPLVIDFKKGWHHVNGEDAVKFLRIRKLYKNSDIDRIGTHQDFLMSIFDELKSPSTIFKLPRLIDIVEKNIETDFNYGQIAYMAYWALDLNRDKIYTDTVQGRGERIPTGPNDMMIDYYIISKENARAQLNKFPNNMQDLSITEEMRVYKVGKDASGQQIENKTDIERKAEDRLYKK